MNRRVTFSLPAAAAMLALAMSGSTMAQQAAMTFFVTSAGSGNGADLGGLAGADQRCQQLAQAAGAGGHTWHAYLSAQAANGQPAATARDRIGKGAETVEAEEQRIELMTRTSVTALDAQARTAKLSNNQEIGFGNELPGEDGALAERLAASDQLRPGCSLREAEDVIGAITSFPVFAPNGKFMLFVQHLPGHHPVIRRLDVQSGKSKVLVQGTQPDWQPVA